MKMRSELLYFPNDDGTLDILDLLLERTHTLTQAQSQLLQKGRAGDLEALSQLEPFLTQSLLLEGPVADVLRNANRSGRTRAHPTYSQAEQFSVQTRWDIAEELPPWVASEWRHGERWRRLAEDRIGGRLLVRLESFVDRDACKTLLRDARQLPFTRRDSAYVRGEGCDLEPHHMDWVLNDFRTKGALHTLISGVMGEDLPTRLFLRVWKLSSGDSMAIHKDGIHYPVTFSIGLCERWTAAQGGAIAFGDPSHDGLLTHQRWIPHLGDLLVFRPCARTWHAVEPVLSGIRYTLTGHYVSPHYPG